MCSIEYFHVAKEQFRIAPGNETVRAWPFETKECIPGSKQLLESIRDDYIELLAICNISHDDSFVANICSKGHSDTEDILVILTRDVDTDMWQYAANNIKKLIDNTISERNSALRITVEIRNPMKMYRDSTIDVQPDPRAYEACKNINDISSQFYHLIPGFTSLSFEMRGPRKEDADPRWPTAAVPSMMICVQDGMHYNWALVEDQIRVVVGDIATDLEVEVHLEIWAGDSK
ncbi:hypothetical protein HYALB_00000077 [Hymenoscyphus albidus]|uniref:Uncharacterized protein n=1 Tax=Hymenoscyphus albidus TaxID=595503 RepID=A0A9N9LHQ1_9HELO|nr:hypothetical protein HYALB_00000077 [Hymenoscyphus albidus]